MESSRVGLGRRPQRASPSVSEPGLASTMVAYLLVASSPALAWLIWLSWVEDEASDASALAWVATVAVSATLAGSLCRRRWYHVIALALLATASAVRTLYLWWSSTSDDNLIMVGVFFFAPMALAVSPLLIKVGLWLAWRRRAAAEGRLSP